jgi:hypothetical protein
MILSFNMHDERQPHILEGAREMNPLMKLMGH